MSRCRTPEACHYSVHSVITCLLCLQEEQFPACRTPARTVSVTGGPSLIFSDLFPVHLFCKHFTGAFFSLLRVLSNLATGRPFVNTNHSLTATWSDSQRVFPVPTASLCDRDIWSATLDTVYPSDQI